MAHPDATSGISARRHPRGLASTDLAATKTSALALPAHQRFAVLIVIHPSQDLANPGIAGPSSAPSIATSIAALARKTDRVHRTAIAPATDGTPRSKAHRLLTSMAVVTTSAALRNLSPKAPAATTATARSPRLKARVMVTIVAPVDHRRLRDLATATVTVPARKRKATNAAPPIAALPLAPKVGLKAPALKASTATSAALNKVRRPAMVPRMATARNPLARPWIAVLTAQLE